MEFSAIMRRLIRRVSWEALQKPRYVRVTRGLKSEQAAALEIRFSDGVNGLDRIHQFVVAESRTHRARSARSTV